MVGIKRNINTTLRTNRPSKLIIKTEKGSSFTIMLPIGVEFTSFITDNDNVNIDLEIINDSSIHSVT